jgi:hypothetical protein
MQLGKLDGFQTYQVDSCKTEQIERQLCQRVRPHLQNEKCDFIRQSVEVSLLTSKHHWLIIACDSCGTVIDLDLTVKLPIGIAWTTFGVALQPA